MHGSNEYPNVFLNQQIPAFHRGGQVAGMTDVRVIGLHDYNV
jgi:hypothetical protein